MEEEVEEEEGEEAIARSGGSVSILISLIFYMCSVFCI